MAVTKCCCLDLRTGTLVIFWIQAMNILSIFKVGGSESILPVIGGITGLLGLYAIYKEKPEFMWPSMIVHILGVVLFTIGAIGVLLLIFGFVSFPMEGTSEDKVRMKDTFTAVLIVLEIGIILAAVLYVYFYRVIKAYFNQMNAELAAKAQSIHANNMERGIYPKV